MFIYFLELKFFFNHPHQHFILQFYECQFLCRWSADADAQQWSLNNRAYHTHQPPWNLFGHHLFIEKSNFKTIFINGIFSKNEFGVVKFWVKVSENLKKITFPAFFIKFPTNDINKLKCSKTHMMKSNGHEFLRYLA